MNDRVTETELNQIMSKPEYKSTTVIRVYEDSNGELTTEWNGNTIKASNVFQLDSRLSDIGVPRPRNLFNMEIEPNNKSYLEEGK